MRWQDRGEVKKAHQPYFELMFHGVSQRLVATESVTPLPGGGAIVAARLAVRAFRQLNGVVKPTSGDRLTLVLVPRDGGLAIRDGANVGTIAEAVRTIVRVRLLLVGDACHFIAVVGAG